METVIHLFFSFFIVPVTAENLSNERAKDTYGKVLVSYLDFKPRNSVILSYVNSIHCHHIILLVICLLCSD